MANAVEDTPRIPLQHDYENEGNNNINPPANIINPNVNSLSEFIIEYQLQQVEEQLLRSGLSIDMLLSLSDKEIDDISKELTESTIARVKFKFALKQKVKSNNNIQIFENNNKPIVHNKIDHPKTHIVPPARHKIEHAKTDITLILSDTRQFKYNMGYNDTFWTVYSNLLQSASDLTSKLFDLQLPNGHILKENEFDQRLSEHKLIPKGIIYANYRNNHDDSNSTKIDVHVTENDEKFMIVYPVKKKHTFNMNTKDTIWTLYSLLLQSIPELGTKVFALQLSNGHVLKEYEFDLTLQHLQLVPHGDITVNFGNRFHKNSDQFHKNSNQNSHYNKYKKYNKPKAVINEFIIDNIPNDFFRTVRNGLACIVPSIYQCNKCGLKFKENSQRYKHQTTCSK